MRKRNQTFAAVLLLLGGPLAGCDDEVTPPVDGTDVPTTLVQVASGLVAPVHLTAPAGDPRLFIVEQQGRIRIVQNNQLVTTPFLDITSRVAFGGERGLLSVAFHPQYATNGFFFVYYTAAGSGALRIERYRVSSNANVADVASASLVLEITHPAGNHNGGHALFGPDGMLYLGIGDGGGGGDPDGNGQNRNTLLGDILRIDINTAPYVSPASNPYTGTSPFRDEIWASGVRNPWRLAFDRTENLLYVADVGQGRIEEINVVPAGTGGLNFGWDTLEGTECFEVNPCSSAGMTPPVVQYGHNNSVPIPAPNNGHPTGCTVIGGIVYRGQNFSAIRGHYFYADLCGRWIRSFRYSNGQATDRRGWDLGDIGGMPLSFGEDSAGEMYIMSDAGRVYRFN
jgi:glucose/arabinose dehydrogenase